MKINAKYLEKIIWKPSYKQTLIWTFYKKNNYFRFQFYLLQNNEIYRHIQKIYIHRVRNKASPFQDGLLDISNNDGKVEYFDNYGELIDTMSVAKGRKRSRRRKKRTQRRRRRRKSKERESRRKSRSKPNKSN